MEIKNVMCNIIIVKNLDCVMASHFMSKYKQNL